MCGETVYRNNNMASSEQIEKLVVQKLVPFASAITISTPLCQSHCRSVPSLHARQPYTSCGSKPKRGEKRPFQTLFFTRSYYCYLTTISGEVSTLAAPSTVCMSCYRFFNLIGKDEHFI